MSTYMKISTWMVLAAVRRTTAEIRQQRAAIKLQRIAELLNRNNRWYARWFGIGRVTEEQAEEMVEYSLEYILYRLDARRLCTQLLDLMPLTQFVTISVEDATLIGLNKPNENQAHVPLS